MTPNGEIGAWNPSAENIFGYTAAEVLGCKLDMLVLAEREAEEQAKMLIYYV